MRSFSSVQDILNFAIEEEKRARLFYENLAGLVLKEDVKRTLKKFAIDELRHKLRLEGVRDGDVMLQDEEIGSLGLADSIQATKPHSEMTYRELLAYAIQKEQRAFQFYTHLSQITKDPIIREMFAHLAQEEAEHKLNLEIEYDLT